MKIVTALFCMLFAFASIAQVTYQKVFRNADFPSVMHVTATTDRGYIMAGGIGVLGSTNVFLLKTDSLGNKLWEKQYDGQSYEVAYGVCEVMNGGFAVTGAIWNINNNSSDLLLLKLNDTGIIEWSKSFGGSISQDYGTAIKQTSDGGFIVVGQTAGGGIIGSAVYIVKTDNTGNTQWTKTYNVAGDGGMHVSETTNGYVIGGYTSTFGMPYFTFIMNIDYYGNPVWSKYISSNSSILGSAIQTDDGGFLFGGVLATATDDGICLMKTDSQFNIQWAKQYASNIPNVVFDFVSQTSDKGYIIGCETLDAITIKTDLFGNVVWSKILNKHGNDDARFMQQLNDTGYIFIGNASDSLNTSKEIWFIKANDTFGNTCFVRDTSINVTNLELVMSSMNFAISSLDSCGNIGLVETNVSTFDSLICFSPSTYIPFVPQLHSELSVFPNPTTGMVTFQATEKITLIEITDATGVTVFRRNANASQLSIYLKHVSTGIYFYKVQTGRNDTRYGKLMMK